MNPLQQLYMASRLAKHDQPGWQRATEGAGAVAGAAGGAAVLASGLGKSAPSFLDLAHQLSLGPNGPALFDYLKSIDPAGGAKLEALAQTSPGRFKLALLGLKVPGVEVATQQALTRNIFQLRPANSTLGDVLVNGPKEEITSGIGRLRHTLVGSPLHHTAIGLPERMNQYAFNAGRNQGVQFWRGDLGDVPGASVLLRPKQPVNAEKLTGAINDTFTQPYSYGRLKRLASHELLSPPWMDKSQPTFTEKALGWVNQHPTLRKNLKAIPGLRQPLVEAAAARRMCQGHVCSTAIADALNQAGAVDYAGKSVLGVTPGDFLRGAGKSFDVAALNLPSELRARPQLLLNHLMKAGPMASRALVAAPFIAGAGYLGHRALQKQARIKRAGFGDVAMGAANMGTYLIPGVGTARMGYDAYKDFSQGHLLSGGANLLGAGLSLIPGVGGGLGMMTKGLIRGAGLGAKGLGYGSAALAGGAKAVGVGGLSNAFSRGAGMLGRVGETAWSKPMHELMPGTNKLWNSWNNGVAKQVGQAHTNMVSRVGGAESTLGKGLNGTYNWMKENPGKTMLGSGVIGAGMHMLDGAADQSHSQVGRINEMMSQLRAGASGFNPMYGLGG